MKYTVLALASGLACIAGSFQSPQQGGQLRLALQAEPKTLDPLLASDEPSLLVKHLTAGVLIRLNRVTQELEPELAVSWKVTEGGRLVAFRLRPGVTFSDGTPFAAEDVCYTIRRLLEPGLESMTADALRFDKGAIACHADSADNVSLRLPRPRVGFELVWDQTAMLSAKSPLRDKAVLGPFVVSEQKAGAYIVLSRNPKYWKRDENGRRLPYLDSIRLEVQRNRDFELLRFLSGDLQIVNNLSPEAYEKLKAERPSAVRALGVSLDSEQLWFNQAPRSPIPAYKKNWFQLREFRLAISQAINRSDLVKVVYRGLATPAVGPVSPANRFWCNSALRPLVMDRKSALEHLAKAGFQLRGQTLRDAAGNPVEFSIVTNSGNKSRQRMSTMIQEDLAAIGIRVSVAPLDFPSLIDRITQTLDYEACLLGMVAGDLDPNEQMNVWPSSAGQHQWNPSQKKPATEWEAELDRLMQEQASALDPKKRKASFDRVQQIVVDQAPFIYLVYPNAAVAVAPSVRNLDAAVLRPQTLWNAEHIYLDTRYRTASR